MDEEEYDAGEEEEHEEGEDADGGARAGPGAVVRSVVRGADGVLVDAGVEPVVGLVRRAADRVQFRVTPRRGYKQERFKDGRLEVGFKSICRSQMTNLTINY